MARSDLLITLVRAGTSGDDTLFRRAVEALIAEERAQHHHVLAERLEKQLETNGAKPSPTLRTQSGARDFVFEMNPERSLDDLLLPELVVNECRELIEEHQRVDLLRSFNLEPRHRVLLAGPPGNGKTSLAEAIASGLMVPMVILRYEGVIGSFLGETASRIRMVFDYVRTRHCVLFLDEFDTLGKERGDPHDTGEIKRVVSSLLLQVDAIPSHVVVITATNHPELLDRAVWRRFQLRLELPPPDRSHIRLFLKRLEERLDFRFEYSADKLTQPLCGASFSELEEFALDIARRRILSMPDADTRKIVGDRLRYWKARVKP